MSKKKTDTQENKTVNTPAPAGTTPAVVAEVPKKERKQRDPNAINTRTFEYEKEKVEEFGALLLELEEKLPLVPKKAEKPEKNTTRNILFKYWPTIKAMIAKGHTKKYVCEQINSIGLKVEQPTFANAVKAFQKADEEKAAAAAAGIEVDMTNGNTLIVPDEPATSEELKQAEREVDATHIHELHEPETDVVKIP